MIPWSGPSIFGQQVSPADPDHPVRDLVRDFLARFPSPTRAQLAEAGLVMPHWPVPWGLGVDGPGQLAVEEELGRAGVVAPPVGNEHTFVGPALLTVGSPEQQERFLPGILNGAERWCRLFSEPSAGSDLRSIECRAQAVPGGWTVTGQKLWAPGARDADFGLLLARTGGSPAADDGPTMFVCPMGLPGVSVRPIRDATGGEMLNEIFLDDVELQEDAVIGTVGNGLSLCVPGIARRLAFTSGAIWGNGPDVLTLISAAVTAPETASAPEQVRLTELFVESALVRMTALRSVLCRHVPDHLEAVHRRLLEQHGAALGEQAMRCQGVSGLVAPDSSDPRAAWSHVHAMAPALSVAAGASEIHLDRIAESFLGRHRIPRQR